MDGFEVCCRVRATGARLRVALEDYRRLCEMQGGLVANCYGVRIGGAGDDAMATMCAHREDALRECERLRRIYAAELCAANTALGTLSGLRQDVIYRYYLAGQSVNAVARAVERTPGTVKRLKREGAAILRKTRVDMPDWYENAAQILK